MRIVLGAAALVLSMAALTACGNDSSTDHDSAGATAEKTKSDRPAATMTVKQACPKVESLLNDYGNFGPTSKSQLSKFERQVRQLEGEATEETKNALELLRTRVHDAVAVFDDPSSVLPRADAAGDLIDGIDAFAHRCKLAGSTALQ